MIDTVVHRVASEEALDFWAERLGGEGIETERTAGKLRFADPEGLAQELAVVETDDPPLIAHAAEVPDELALQGFEGRQGRSAPRPARSERLLGEVMGFREVAPGNWETRAENARRAASSSPRHGARPAGRRHDPPHRLVGG